MDDVGHLVVSLVSLPLLILILLGEGSPWQGLKRIIEFLWEGIKGLLLNEGPAIPRPDYDRIEELERWNREWTHPDL